MSENNAPSDKLVWLDLEMTGLDPDRDRILEIAMVVTDNDLNVLAEAPVIACTKATRCSPRWTTGTRRRTALPA